MNLLWGQNKTIHRLKFKTNGLQGPCHKFFFFFCLKKDAMRPNPIKRCPNNLKFMVDLFDGILRPSTGFGLKIMSLKDLVPIRAFFVSRRMQSGQALLE